MDVTLPTYNIDPERIEAAVSPRTRAIMIAHTLGNPFDLDAVMDVAKRHNLWVVGLAQMDRLERFVEARKKNFQHLRRRLAPLADRLMLPDATPNSDPSWFGFAITMLPSAGKTLEQLTAFLERNKIGTRLLFGGNLTRQLYFRGRPHRISGTLENTDLVMEHAFWIGVYPGLSVDMLDFSADKIIEFMGRA